MLTVKVSSGSNCTRLCDDNGDYPKGLPKKIIDDVYDVKSILTWSSDLKDLLADPRLGFRKQGERKGHYEIRLNEKWRLLFRIDKSTKPITITVAHLDKGHYSK